MRCYLVTFTVFVVFLNYIFGYHGNYIDFLRTQVHGYNLSDDYSSGDQAEGGALLLAGVKKKSKRGLVAGDTFTPQEMLPIAEKLLKKVEEPGYGKGFVSSTKGPKELADKLFEAFFFDTKRIVTLKDQDIIGIDALQALALEGEDADNTLKGDVVTEPADKVFLRGQFVELEKPKPLKSRYKLVTKVIPLKTQRTQKNITKEKRRGIPLSKKLPPKRHLVVNESPQNRDRSQKIHKKYNRKVTSRVWNINKHGRNKSPNVRMGPRQDKKEPSCRWKYVCSMPDDLDTCRVYTTCGSSTSPATSAQKQNDKNDMLIEQFRRMVGITAVDEEVEKILEVRNLKLRPVNLEAQERVESLAEFFNNIIVRENMESTTSVTGEDFSTVPSDVLTPQSDQN